MDNKQENKEINNLYKRILSNSLSTEDDSLFKLYNRIVIENTEEREKLKEKNKILLSKLISLPSKTETLQKNN